MIPEDRVMTIFVEANPVPDVDILNLVEVGSSDYLATLEQRSSNVTQLDARQSPSTRTNRPSRWLAAVAAVIAIIGIGLFVNRGGSEVAETGPPTLTYIGDACTYTGPVDFAVGSMVTFTFVDEVPNSQVGFGIWAIDDSMTVEEILDEGINNNASQVDFTTRQIDDTTFEFSYAFDEPGSFVLNCAKRAEGEPPVDYAHKFTVSE